VTKASRKVGHGAGGLKQIKCLQGPGVRKNPDIEVAPIWRSSHIPVDEKCFVARFLVAGELTFVSVGAGRNRTSHVQSSFN
jgi:hypothetical protein